MRKERGFSTLAQIHREVAGRARNRSCFQEGRRILQNGGFPWTKRSPLLECRRQKKSVMRCRSCQEMHGDGL